MVSWLNQCIPDILISVGADLHVYPVRGASDDEAEVHGLQSHAETGESCCIYFQIALIFQI